MGDPAGIGPEVIAKAMTHRALRTLCCPLIIGSFPVMQRTIKALKLKLKAVPVDGHEAVLTSGEAVPVLDPLNKPLGSFTPGVAAKATGAASVAFIKKGVELALLGCIDGIVTAPINKEAINMAGCRYPGDTELLADLTQAKESGMMIVGGPLRIMFVTTHVPIKDLSSLLTRATIEKSIRLAHRALTEL